MFEWVVAMFARFKELLEAVLDADVLPGWVSKYSLEILLLITMIAGFWKIRTRGRPKMIHTSAELQVEFKRIVHHARHVVGSISANVRFAIIQDLLIKKLESQPELSIYCLVPGIPTASMAEHIERILREFPARVKGPKQNIFIAVLEEIPNSMNVCFNERTAVFTSDARLVLGLDCVATVCVDEAMVNLVRSQAMALYHGSRFKIHCLRELRAAMHRAEVQPVHRGTEQS